MGSSEYAYDSDQNVVAIPPARPGTPRNGPLPPTPVNLPASTSSTPVVPSWVTLEPVGIWREVEEDATTTTSTTLTVDEALTGDEAADTVAEDGTTLENDGVDAISMVQRGIWTLTTSTSSTTTTTSELTWPSEVVRDTVNVNLVHGGLVDVVELIHRLQARQRHLRHCDRLLMDAIEEALSWIQVPLTTTPMNVGTFERNIWAAVTAEARFGSGTSSTQTSQMVSAPSALLQGGFPTTLAQLQEVVPGAPQVVAGYRRRAWQRHVDGLYRDEGCEAQGAMGVAGEDRDLFLIQYDDDRNLSNWPQGIPRPEVMRRARLAEEMGRGPEFDMCDRRPGGGRRRGRVTRRPPRFSGSRGEGPAPGAHPERSGLPEPHPERSGLPEPHALPAHPGLSEPHALPRLPVRYVDRDCREEREHHVRREVGDGYGASSSGQVVREGMLCDQDDLGAGDQGLIDDEGPDAEWRHERDQGRERSRSRDE